MNSPRRRRGIYLLPTLFTLGNLFGGCAAIVLATRGDHATAALAIVIAGILDGLDGRIARLTRTSSDFGREFDSLADITSFGLAPAFVVLSWGLGPAGRWGEAIAFLYVVCAATRLARFNIQAERRDARYFAGLPSPPAGGTIAALVFAFPVLEQSVALSAAVAVFLTALGLLMVSHVRYRSFKEIDLSNRRSRLLVVPLALLLALIILEPRIGLLAFAACYVLSAPVAYIVGAVQRKPHVEEDLHEPVGRQTR